jgi:hypothetical protein
MKTSHLHDMWGGPDNSRLVSRQFSFRLPVHVAAKIAALSDMYPTKNRTQIVADLLTAALDDLERNLPAYKGGHIATAPVSPDDPGCDEYVDYFLIEGPRGRFFKLTDIHYLQLEKELGNEVAQPLHGNAILSADQFTDK